jgi:hypothetical protein
MSGWDEVKTWVFECDGCPSIKRVVDTDKPFNIPEGWTTVTRKGGGHYGLPHHHDTYCPRCVAKGKASGGI